MYALWCGALMYPTVNIPNFDIFNCSATRSPFVSRYKEQVVLFFHTRSWPSYKEQKQLFSCVCSMAKLHFDRLSQVSHTNEHWWLSARLMRSSFFSLCLSLCFSLSRLFQTHTGHTHTHTHTRTRAHTHTHTRTEDSIKINLYEMVQIEKLKLHLQLQIKYTKREVLLLSVCWKGSPCFFILKRWNTMRKKKSLQQSLNTCQATMNIHSTTPRLLISMEHKPNRSVSKTL